MSRASSTTTPNSVSDNPITRPVTRSGTRLGRVAALSTRSCIAVPGRSIMRLAL
ncbi:MAG: hypothetical protein ACSLE9_18350 [Burkholderiaceae bacterium]